MATSSSCDTNAFRKAVADIIMGCGSHRHMIIVSAFDVRCVCNPVVCGHHFVVKM